jgi:hypothetical protein
MLDRIRGHVYRKVMAAALTSAALAVVNVANAFAEVYPGELGALAQAVAPILAAYLTGEADRLVIVAELDETTP